MRGAAPDGGEVQLLVREARNGLAPQRNSLHPHPTKLAPSCSPSLMPGSWVMYGLAVLTPGCRLWVRTPGSLLAATLWGWGLCAWLDRLRCQSLFSQPGSFQRLWPLPSLSGRVRVPQMFSFPCQAEQWVAAVFLHGRLAL